MPPQNILISLRCAPLHQDILHRGLTNGSIQFILKKEKERLISRSHHKVIFLQLIVFTEFFFAEPSLLFTVLFRSLRRGAPQRCPVWTASLVWSEFWRLLRLHGLIFRTLKVAKFNAESINFSPYSTPNSEYYPQKGRLTPWWGKNLFEHASQ